MIYDAVKTIPIIIPVIAPSRFIRLSKIPKIIAGKKEDAANQMLMPPLEQQILVDSCQLILQQQLLLQLLF